MSVPAPTSHIASASAAKYGYEFVSTKLGERFESFAQRLDALQVSSGETCARRLATLAHEAAHTLGGGTPPEFEAPVPCTSDVPRSTAEGSLETGHTDTMRVQQALQEAQQQMKHTLNMHATQRAARQPELDAATASPVSSTSGAELADPLFMQQQHTNGAPRGHQVQIDHTPSLVQEEQSAVSSQQGATATAAARTSSPVFVGSSNAAALPGEGASALYSRLERAAVERGKLESSLAAAEERASAAERRARAAEATASATHESLGSLASELADCRSQLEHLASEERGSIGVPTAWPDDVSELRRRLTEVTRAATEAVAERSELQARVGELEREPRAHSARTSIVLQTRHDELASEYEALQADFAALFARAARDRDALRSLRAANRVLVELKDVGERPARDRAALRSTHARVDRHADVMHRRAVELEAENRACRRLLSPPLSHRRKRTPRAY